MAVTAYFHVANLNKPLYAYSCGIIIVGYIVAARSTVPRVPVPVPVSFSRAGLEHVPDAPHYPTKAIAWKAVPWLVCVREKSYTITSSSTRLVQVTPPIAFEVYTRPHSPGQDRQMPAILCHLPSVGPSVTKKRRT